jgi:hypothetical protein
MSNSIRKLKRGIHGTNGKQRKYRHVEIYKDKAGRELLRRAVTWKEYEERKRGSVRSNETNNDHPSEDGASQAQS